MAGNEILLSLIVSTRGRTTPLERLFESFVAQEYKNFEVIVVDQNLDDCLDPLFAKQRWPFPLRRIRTPQESGLSRGRNKGWQHAQGEIIVFPDDDCWYPSWFLARGMAQMEATGADFLSGRAADQDGNSINGRFEKVAQPIDRDNVWTTGIEWTIFFKRAALAKVGGIQPRNWHRCINALAVVRGAGHYAPGALSAVAWILRPVDLRSP